MHLSRGSKGAQMKLLFILLGFLFLGIGMVGAVLPVLPTVPFLLLSSFFFGKSSKRINDWFISTGVYKRYLRDFVETGAMTRKAKIITLAAASFMLIASFIFSKPMIARVLIVLAIAFKYYYFMFRIKTIRKGDLQPGGSKMGAPPEDQSQKDTLV